MLTLNYAKKVTGGYVMNFYADTEEDVTAFNGSKDFLNYGKPVAGSVVTMTGSGANVNYYLGLDGNLALLPLTNESNNESNNASD